MKQTSYQIDCKNAVGVKALLSILVERGFETSSGLSLANYLEGYSHLVWVCIFPEKKTFGGNWFQVNSHTTLSLDEFFANIHVYAPLEVLVKLDSTHTARVTKGGITVGCTSFPISVLDALISARNAVQSLK